MIEGERKNRTLWVFGLDGVSVALAVALAVLALQDDVARRRRSCGAGRRSWKGSRGGWRTIC